MSNHLAISVSDETLFVQLMSSRVRYVFYYSGLVVLAPNKVVCLKLSCLLSFSRVLLKIPFSG